MIVIKLGGSAITVKSEPYTPREDVIRRIPEEISVEKKLVLIHGAGSFGHHVVLEHKIHRGLSTEEQILVAAKLKRDMQDLTNLLLDALLSRGIPAFPFYPSSFIIYEGMKPIKRNIEPIFGFLEVGLVPLIPPDGAYDKKQGFSIVSGDVSAMIIAKELKAEKVVFGVDVDGILDEEGSLIPELSPEEALEIAKKIIAKDASGGMAMKLKISAELAREGIPVYIVNLLEPGRLRGILLDEEVPCTVIRERFLRLNERES